MDLLFFRKRCRLNLLPDITQNPIVVLSIFISNVFSTYLHHRASRIRSSQTGFPIKSRKNFLVRFYESKWGRNILFPSFFHFISLPLSLSHPLHERNDIDERLNFPIGLLAIGKTLFRNES